MPSVCMQSSLTAIGGVDASTAPTSTARSMTTRGPSSRPRSSPTSRPPQTPSRSSRPGRRKCAKQAKSLGLKKVQVSQDQRGPRPSPDPGEQWLVTYRPVPGDPDSAWLQAEGFVRDGDTLTYLVMTTAGQDYNYEAGQEPMAQALGVAGETVDRLALIAQADNISQPGGIDAQARARFRRTARCSWSADVVARNVAEAKLADHIDSQESVHGH